MGAGPARDGQSSSWPLLSSLRGADAVSRRLHSPRALHLTAPWRFAVAPAAALVAFLVQLGVSPRPSSAPFVFFFAAVALSSWLGGRGPGLVCVVLSAALANVFFVTPPWIRDRWSAAIATALFLAAASLVALLCAAFRQSVFRMERTAQALGDSERRALARAAELQAVLDLVPAAVWIARDPSADRIEANRFGSDLLEQPRDANISVTGPAGEAPTNFRPVRNGAVIPDDDLPIQAAARRGLEVRDYEFDLAFEDGRVRHLLGGAAPVRDAEGRVTGSVGAFIDITERKRAEASLAESEARFRRLADALPQMVFDLDAAGRGGYFNEQWLGFTGSRSTDREGRLALVHPEDRARAERRWTEALEGGAAFECEYRFRRHDGQYRWVLARAVPVRDAEGRLARWFGTLTDIHEIRLTQEAMSETARLKDDFLAMLSHELRNPLAPITNSVYILEHVDPGGEQARRARDVIARQTAHLSTLVSQLLDATRLTRHRIELRRERLDLNEAVGRAVEDHRDLFEKSGVSLEFAPAPERVPVDADPTRLAQVVGNLLHNAAKFTPPGGHARVRVGSDPEGATIRVRDDGVGIGPGTLARLFQPFTQARQALDRNRGGLGLGLALVKGLVELHGGSVSVSSEGPGRGSEFVVRLPPPSRTGRPAEPTFAPVAGSRGGVLANEDDADDYRV